MNPVATGGLGALIGALAMYGALTAPLDPEGSSPGSPQRHMEAVDQFNRLALWLGCEGSVLDEESLQRGVDNLVQCLEQKRAERLVSEAERTTDLMEALTEQDRLRARVVRLARQHWVDRAWYGLLAREGLHPRTEAVP